MKRRELSVPPRGARTVRAAAWLVCALCVVSGAIALILEPINRSGPYTTSDLYPGALVIAVLFPLIGALIATRRPGNWVGWILIGMGLSEAISALTGPYAIYALFTHPDPPGGVLASWINAWSWLPGFTLTAVLLLLFPTGRLLSRRWAVVAWAAALGTVLETLAIAIAGWPLRGQYLIIHRDSTNPATAGSIVGVLDAIAGALILVSLLVSVVSIIVRFRRAGGVERQQIKWFTYAAALAALMLLASIELNPNGGYLNGDIFNIVVTALQTLAYAGVACAIGIAILRHRLYDIDLIINRTLVYGSLTALLAVVYVGSVIGLQHLAATLAGPQASANPLIIVVSTLLIVVLFTPLRRRIQRFIDRRFYRSKYDAARTLERFAVTLRSEVELGTLSDHLLAVVDETMRPTSALLWIRQPRPREASGVSGVSGDRSS